MARKQTASKSAAPVGEVLITKLKAAGDKAAVSLKGQRVKAGKALSVAKKSFKDDVQKSKVIAELKKEISAIEKDSYIAKLEKIVLKQSVEIASLKGE
jgi:hypothetical protein